MQMTAERTAVAIVVHLDPSASPFGGSWLQFPPPWMEPFQMAYNNFWVMCGASQSMLRGHLSSMSYENLWMLMLYSSEVGPRHDSVTWASLWHKFKEYDVVAMSRTTSGHKPNTVKEGETLIKDASGRMRRMVLLGAWSHGFWI